MGAISLYGRDLLVGFWGYTQEEAYTVLQTMDLDVYTLLFQIRQGNRDTGLLLKSRQGIIFFYFHLIRHALRFRLLGSLPIFMDKKVVIYNNNTGITASLRPLLRGENIKLLVAENRKQLRQIMGAEQIHLLITDGFRILYSIGVSLTSLWSTKTCRVLSSITSPSTW